VLAHDELGRRLRAPERLPLRRGFAVAQLVLFVLARDLLIAAVDSLQRDFAAQGLHDFGAMGGTTARSGPREGTPPGVVIDLTAAPVLTAVQRRLPPIAPKSWRPCAAKSRWRESTARDEEIAREDEEDKLSDREIPARQKGQALWGAEPPAELIVREHGMRIAVDVRAGQKDRLLPRSAREPSGAAAIRARTDRAWPTASPTRRFSVSAALGGAAEVVSIDRDAAAIRLARRNFELNGLDRRSMVSSAPTFSNSCTAPTSRSI